MNSLRSMLCTLLIGLTLPAASFGETSTPPSAALLERLKTLYPATRFGAVSPTPWLGVFEVAMGNNIAYVDETGQFFLFGHLYDMKAQPGRRVHVSEAGCGVENLQPFEKGRGRRHARLAERGGGQGKPDQ